MVGFIKVGKDGELRNEKDRLFMENSRMSTYVGTVLPEKQLRYVLRKQGLVEKGHWHICLKTFQLTDYKAGFNCSDDFYTYMDINPYINEPNKVYYCFHKDWFIPMSLKIIDH